MIGNIMLRIKSMNNLPNFKNWFTLCSEIQNSDRVSSSTDKLSKTSYRTDSYAKNCITTIAANTKHAVGWDTSIFLPNENQKHTYQYLC